MNGKRVTILVALAALMSAPAWAQDGNQAGTGTREQHGGSAAGRGAAATKPLPKKLTESLEKLHASNQGEIQVGQYAEKNAQSNAVKEYAQTLVRDHQQNDQQLQQTAQSLNVNLEGKTFESETKKKQESAKKLESKQGAQFDTAFADSMVKDHDKDVKDVRSAQKEAARSGHRELAAFLGQTDQVLSKHLTDAQQLKRTVEQEQRQGTGTGGTGGTGSTSKSSKHKSSGQQGTKSSHGGSGSNAGSSSTGQ